MAKAVILVAGHFAATIPLGGEQALSVVGELFVVAEGIGDFFLTVKGIVGVGKNPPFGIGLGQHVAVGVVGIGDGLRHGVNLLQHLVAGIETGLAGMPLFVGLPVKAAHGVIGKGAHPLLAAHGVAFLNLAVEAVVHEGSGIETGVFGGDQVVAGIIGVGGDAARRIGGGEDIAVGIVGGGRDEATGVGLGDHAAQRVVGGDGDMAQGIGHMGWVSILISDPGAVATSVGALGEKARVVQAGGHIVQRVFDLFGLATVCKFTVESGVGHTGLGEADQGVQVGLACNSGPAHARYPACRIGGASAVALAVVAVLHNCGRRAGLFPALHQGQFGYTLIGGEGAKAVGTAGIGSPVNTVNFINDPSAVAVHMEDDIVIHSIDCRAGDAGGRQVVTVHIINAVEVAPFIVQPILDGLHSTKIIVCKCSVIGDGGLKVGARVGDGGHPGCTVAIGGGFATRIGGRDDHIITIPGIGDRSSGKIGRAADPAAAITGDGIDAATGIGGPGDPVAGMAEDQGVGVAVFDALQTTGAAACGVGETVEQVAFGVQGDGAVAISHQFIKIAVVERIPLAVHLLVEVLGPFVLAEFDGHDVKGIQPRHRIEVERPCAGAGSPAPRVVGAGQGKIRPLAADRQIGGRLMEIAGGDINPAQQLTAAAALGRIADLVFLDDCVNAALLGAGGALRIAALQDMGC